ncbi:MAG: outer membrane protein assembly factor BamD [Thiobacillus sp.]|nr:outer membrane protein assembly factor BamD [Thiobacillus sp.]
MSNLSGFLMRNRLILACAADRQIFADKLRRYPFVKAFLLAAVLAISFVQGNAVYAVQGGGVYEAMLPPYCQGGKRLFHYCESLIYLYRAESSYGRSGSRQKEARHALNGIEYTLRYLYPSHPYVMDVRLSLVKALFLSDDYGRAITEAQKILEINPNHAQAYSLLIDSYIKINLKNKALKVAEEGLRHVPDSKRLQRNYLELGGKTPFPAPHVAAPGEVDAAPPAAVIAPDTPAEASGPMAAPSVADRKVTPAIPESATPAGSEEAKPKNPWCRFCP